MSLGSLFHFCRFTLISLGGFGLVLAPAQAVTFQAPIDQTDWKLMTSKFECRLSQPIPDFGTAVFERRAGEQLRFVLDTAQRSLFGRETLIVAESPAWLPGNANRQIGRVETPASSQIRVDQALANDMLVSLYKGQSPALTNGRWNGTKEPVKVAISSANFQDAYSSYKGCIAELLPVNYKQIARSAVLFPSAQWRLSDATKKRLDLVALYVQTDKTVKAIYVDGHSDNLGRRLANRDLSRKRAEEVTKYLVKVGIDEEMVTTRYHGERYPVIKNRNNETRTRNRRVTVRLERDS
ncbi:MAG: OmpA family protein [Motiliproteus sp.]|nr:OmpA family protein [Motiliproteus sp.]MCW9054309.1 OmpA family protein [Motiliproteus sp.]